MKGRKDVNKTVRHCGVCQENFGDRFSFCPVCGEPLEAVEVGQNEAFAAAPTRDNAQIQREEAVAATTAPLIAENAPHFVSQKTNGSVNGVSNFQDNQPKKASEPENKVKQAVNKTVQPLSSRKVATGDGLYHLTMLQAPPTYRRYLGYGAMLGLFLLLTSGIALMIADIYNYKLDLESPESTAFLSAVSVNDEPPFKEEKEIERKNSDKGGGGGGGGGNDPKPASKGGNPAQAPEAPTYKPSVHIPRLENPALAVQPTVQTPNRVKADEGPVGIKSATSDVASDGPGRNGGIGTGNNGGVGSGLNSGIGSGRNGGIGSGSDGGIGPGRGPGQNGDAPAPKPVAAVTEKLKIIAKPTAKYTDEARKNQISGTVRLRVTFSASGQVTNISAVSGLPYGLTDQAIAAARLIQFIPQKQNGVPVSISRPVEFNFNLY